jgi:hypothetical protein
MMRAAASGLCRLTANSRAACRESQPLSTRVAPKDKPPGIDCAAPPMEPRQGAVGMSVGVIALAAATLMSVFSVVALLYAELLPALDADDWLLFVDALLWVCDCCCVFESVFVLFSVFLLEFLLLELPELLTPALDVEVPPVALLVEPDVAPDVELAADVELLVVGVVGVVGGVGSVSQTNVKPLSTTTCPLPSPVPVPTVPVGTCTRTWPGVLQFQAKADMLRSTNAASAAMLRILVMMECLLG